MNLVRPLIIAGLVITEVGIWQWRVVIVRRGGRTSAMLLGTLGAILQITAITQVVSDARDPLTISAYAGGVGLGVLFGLLAGDRLTPGMVGATVVTKSPHVAHSLWNLGWPATARDGYSEDGPVTVLFIAIGRRDEAGLHRDVHRIAPAALSTTGELRTRNHLVRRPHAQADAWRAPAHSRAQQPTPPIETRASVIEPDLRSATDGHKRRTTHAHPSIGAPAVRTGGRADGSD